MAFLGTIYVIRHGQAAFGTDHYDRLTEKGFTQSRLLGAHLRERGIRFDAVFTGTLRRQMETAQSILDGHPELGAHLPRESFVGLDEYNPEAIIMAHRGGYPAPTDAAVRREPTVVREHFRMLREALVAWAENRTQPVGMPAFDAFQAAAVAALVEARQRFVDGNVLVVSSGGPIAAMVAASLNAPPVSAVQLNLRIRNTSLTEFSMNPRRHHLVSFNAVPHLDVHEDAALLTYA